MHGPSRGKMPPFLSFPFLQGRSTQLTQPGTALTQGRPRPRQNCGHTARPRILCVQYHEQGISAFSWERGHIWAGDRIGWGSKDARCPTSPRWFGEHVLTLCNSGGQGYSHLQQHGHSMGAEVVACFPLSVHDYSPSTYNNARHIIGAH